MNISKLEIDNVITYAQTIAELLSTVESYKDDICQMNQTINDLLDNANKIVDVLNASLRRNLSENDYDDITFCKYLAEEDDINSAISRSETILHSAINMDSNCSIESCARIRQTTVDLIQVLYNYFNKFVEKYYNSCLL